MSYQYMSTYSTGDLTLPVNPPAGSLLVAVGGSGNADDADTASGGGTWTRLSYRGSTGYGGHIRFHYCVNATGGATTVDIGSPTGDFGWSLHCYDVSGYTFDGETGQAYTGQDPTSGSIVTTGTGILVGAFCTMSTDWAGSYDDSFVERTAEPSNQHRTANKTGVAAGTVEFSLTRAADPYAALAIIAFKAESLVVAQSNFRFRRDDGNEVTAAWDGEQGSNMIAPTGVNRRVRVQISLLDGNGNTTAQLEARKSGHNKWVKVPLT